MPPPPGVALSNAKPLMLQFAPAAVMLATGTPTKPPVLPLSTQFPGVPVSPMIWPCVPAALTNGNRISP